MRRGITTSSSEIEEMAGKMTRSLLGRRLCLLVGSYGTMLTLPILEKESPPMSIWLLLAFDGVLCLVQPTPALRS